MNGAIFVDQGKALNEVAKPTCKVIVVGNPCNTNALIALSHAPNLDPRNFHALTKLDENRAKCQLALKAGVFYETVSNVVIWGNHSTTQVPDFVNAKIDGKKPPRSSPIKTGSRTSSLRDSNPRRVADQKVGSLFRGVHRGVHRRSHQKSLVNADAGGRLVLHSRAQ